MSSVKSLLYLKSILPRSPYRVISNNKNLSLSRSYFITPLQQIKAISTKNAKADVFSWAGRGGSPCFRILRTGSSAICRQIDPSQIAHPPTDERLQAKPKAEVLTD
jgi:hypothetical protein